MIRLKFINSLLKVTDQSVDNLALFCISYVQDTYGFKKVCIFGCCIFFFFLAPCTNSFIFKFSYIGIMM